MGNRRLTKKQKSESIVRDWSKMPHDILLNIFSTLNLLDLALSLSKICGAWRQACSDPTLHWETLDLTYLDNYYEIPTEPEAWSDEDSYLRLMHILDNAFNLSGGNIKNLVFHFYTYITNEHMYFASKRCPGLKRLVLPGWSEITVAGVADFTRVWKGLECLIAPCISFPCYVLRLIGTHCEDFKELKLMRAFNLELARAIVKHTPRLRVLSLRCTVIHILALEYILDNLKSLEILNIAHGLIVHRLSFPIHAYYVQPGLDLSLRVKVQKLKEFYSCVRNLCPICQQKRADEYGYIRWHGYDKDDIQQWHGYEEGLWREDEISSLAY